MVPVAKWQVKRARYKPEPERRSTGGLAHLPAPRREKVLASSWVLVGLGDKSPTHRRRRGSTVLAFRLPSRYQSNFLLLYRHLHSSVASSTSTPLRIGISPNSLVPRQSGLTEMFGHMKAVGHQRCHLGRDTRKIEAQSPRLIWFAHLRAGRSADWRREEKNLGLPREMRELRPISGETRLAAVRGPASLTEIRVAIAPHYRHVPSSNG